MYNSIVKAVRKTISADKTRYENDSFDLDLTYICERVIAMSFPADGVEAAYRNSIHDVAKMLNETHKEHYMIFNLSERKYDYTLFNGKVHDWCGFPDHHAPPLGLLFKIVKTIYGWLEQDSMNVVIVHCMAGKGRTGTIISCLLLYGGLFDNGSDAMRYFAVKRSNNNYGITGPSQIRYATYFSDIYLSGKELNVAPIYLKSITMNTIPKFFNGPLKQGVCPVLNIYSATQKGVRIFTSAPIEGDTKETRQYQSGSATLIFEVRKIVRGDILVVFSHISPFYRMEQIARFNFHTGMFQMPTLILRKSDLDGPDGDKRFSNDFYFKLDFEEVVNQPNSNSENNINNNNNTQFEYQKEIKKEIKWIHHEVNKKEPRTGSIFFFPKNNSEKIKLAKDATSKQGNIGVHSGFLLKKGHNFKSWRRRWFVLKDNNLSYYKSPKDNTPAGVIPIQDILAIEEGSDTAQKDGYNYAFEIITMKSPYTISAENERDLEDWLEILQMAKKSVQVTGRLFLEILEVQYQFSNPQTSYSDGTPFDTITYLTVSLGKKKDLTKFESKQLNPNFQYAADFTVYDQPNDDLEISLFFKSSILSIKETLVAELIIPHSQLLNINLQTTVKKFTKVHVNFLKDLSIQIGMIFRSEEDISLHETKGTYQISVNNNNNNNNNNTNILGGNVTYNINNNNNNIITLNNSNVNINGQQQQQQVFLARSRENKESGGSVGDGESSSNNSSKRNSYLNINNNSSSNSNSANNNAKSPIEEFVNSDSFFEDIQNQLDILVNDEDVLNQDIINEFEQIEN